MKSKYTSYAKMEKAAKDAGFSNIDIIKMKRIAEEASRKMEKEATEKALLYMLAIPLNVLVNDYWRKSAKSRAPKFIKEVWSLYESVQEGAVSNLELRELLDKYAGLRIEAEWIKEGEGDKNHMCNNTSVM